MESPHRSSSALGEEQEARSKQPRRGITYLTEGVSRPYNEGYHCRHGPPRRDRLEPLETGHRRKPGVYIRTGCGAPLFPPVHPFSSSIEACLPFTAVMQRSREEGGLPSNFPLSASNHCPARFQRDRDSTNLLLPDQRETNRKATAARVVPGTQMNTQYVGFIAPVLPSLDDISGLQKQTIDS